MNEGVFFFCVDDGKTKFPFGNALAHVARAKREKEFVFPKVHPSRALCVKGSEHHALHFDFTKKI